MSEAAVLEPKSLTSLTAWSEVAAAAATTALDGQLSRQVPIEVSAVDLVDGETVIAALPAQGFGVIFAATRGEATTKAVLAFDHDAVAALVGLRRELSDDDIKKRQGETGAYDEDEILSLNAVANLLGAAFETQLSNLLGADAKVTTESCAVILDSAWNGEAFMLTGERARVEWLVRWSGDSTANGRLLLDPSMLVEPAAPVRATPRPETEAPPASVKSEAVLALCFDEQLQARVVASLAPQSIQSIADFSEFMKAWKSGLASGGVVEVREGEEAMIPMLAGLHKWPGCEARPLFVLLDKPTVDSVVACGRAGLFDVLPSTFPAEALKDRWLKKG